MCLSCSKWEGVGRDFIDLHIIEEIMVYGILSSSRHFKA